MIEGVARLFRLRSDGQLVALHTDGSATRLTAGGSFVTTLLEAEEKRGAPTAFASGPAGELALALTDGSAVAFGSDDAEARFLDVPGGHPLAAPPSGRALDIVGETVVACNSAGWLCLFDLSGDQETRIWKQCEQLDGAALGCFSVEFSVTGSSLLTHHVNRDAEIMIWDLDELERGPPRSGPGASWESGTATGRCSSGPSNQSLHLVNRRATNCRSRTSRFLRMAAESRPPRSMVRCESSTWTQKSRSCSCSPTSGSPAESTGLVTTVC